MHDPLCATALHYLTHVPIKNIPLVSRELYIADKCCSNSLHEVELKRLLQTSNFHNVLLATLPRVVLLQIAPHNSGIVQSHSAYTNDSMCLQSSRSP